MKRSWLLFGLLISFSLLTPAGGFGQVSLQIGINAPSVHYWYYPAYGVYYDYGAHVYFYLDGGNWVRVAHLPHRFHHLGHHVIVESERDRPWARYEKHREKYPPEHFREDRRGDDRDHDHGDHHRDDH